MQGFIQGVLLLCSTYTIVAGFHTEFKGTPSCLGVCPVKSMILEVGFLLTNFDSVIFKTLYLALNKFNYYSEI